MGHRSEFMRDTFGNCQKLAAAQCAGPGMGDRSARGCRGVVVHVAFDPYESVRDVRIF